MIIKTEPKSGVIDRKISLLTELSELKTDSQKNLTANNTTSLAASPLQQNIATSDLKYYDHMESEIDTEVATGARPRLPRLPVDHGWAWFVLLGATTNVLLLMVFLRSTSLFFIYFLDMYQASAVMTTLVFALSSLTFSVSNIVASTILVKKFSVRALALTGVSITFLSIVGVAFAPTIVIVNVLYAVLGFANGLVIVPQLMLVGRYFKRRLSLATATTTMGISIATIFGTPVTQALIDHFGVHGALMILAGVVLHCVPASMLLRPTTMYAPPLNSTCFNEQSGVNDLTQNNSQTTKPHEESESEQCTIESKRTPQNGYGIHNARRRASSGTVSVHISTQEYLVDDGDNNNLCEDNDYKKDCARYEKTKLNSQTQTVQENGNANGYEKPRKLRRLRSVSESAAEMNNVSVGYNPILQSNMEELEIEGSSHRTAGLKASISNVFSASIRYLSDQRSLYESYASGISHHPGNFRGSGRRRAGSLPVAKLSSVVITEIYDSKGMNTTPTNNKRNMWQYLRRMCACVCESVYLNPVSVVLVLASGIGIHAQGCISYMPAVGIENGLSSEQVPYLMTAFGISDLMSKLCVGFLADSRVVSAIYIVSFTQLLAGVFQQLLVFFQGLPMMLFLQGLIGLCVGVFHVLLPAITVETLGLQFMGHIMAGYMLINGVINALDHVIVGSLKDYTNSFYGSYHFMGALTIMSVGPILLVPVLSRKSKK